MGRSVTIFRFPYDRRAAAAPNVSWKIKLFRWNRKRCKISEISATGKKVTTKAKISDTSDGMIYITGQFPSGSNIKLPYFQLIMTSHVSNEDFRAGYALTGVLQRCWTANQLGNTSQAGWGETRLVLTHFAMVRRKER